MLRDELVSVRAELRRKLVDIVRNLLDALAVNEQLQQALAAAGSAGPAVVDGSNVDDWCAAAAVATASKARRPQYPC